MKLIMVYLIFCMMHARAQENQYELKGKIATKVTANKNYIFS